MLAVLSTVPGLPTADTPGKTALTLGSAPVALLSPDPYGMCTDVDFQTAEVLVSNFGGADYCCLLNDDDPEIMTCPSLAQDGTSIVRTPLRQSLRRALACTVSFSLYPCALLPESVRRII